jgi:hypothetical protein
MSRFALFIAAAVLSLQASTALAKKKTAEGVIVQDKEIPRYAVGKVTRSFLVTTGAYTLAAGTTGAILVLNSFCDANGDVIQLGCNSFGFPVLGVFTAAGLTAAAVAPSSAHWKIGDTNHAYLTTGIRLAGSSMVLVGLKEFIDNDLNGKAKGFMGVGGGLLLGLGLYDIIDAGLAPRRVAKKQHEAISLRLQPAPIFSKGQTSLGLSATLKF